MPVMTISDMPAGAPLAGQQLYAHSFARQRLGGDFARTPVCRLLALASRVPSRFHRFVAALRRHEAPA
jgi:hypothetical protein